jgi:hypothetical protein
MNHWISMEYEHRNPLAYMLLPRSLLRQAPAAAASLRANRARFLTHLDLYKTLTSLIGAWTEDASQPAHVSVYDLLSETVDAGRTCKSADIMDKWCMCFGFKPKQAPPRADSR